MFLAQYFPPSLDPGSPPAEGVTRTGYRYLRTALTPELAASVSAGLTARASELQAWSGEKILSSLDALHRNWAAPGSGLREKAVEALHAATGYARGSIDASLRQLFASLDRREMEGWLHAAGIPLAALDGFTTAARGDLRVYGPTLGVLIASGNIPGAALPTLVQFLLLKSPLLVKTSGDEPVLLPLYARSLAELDPELAAGLAVTGWAGGDAGIEAAVFGAADAVAVYGSDATLATVRARLRPHARFIGYGHRLSFTVLTREVLAEQALPAVARAVAMDYCLFDQQGCLSPQTVFVERGGEVDPEGLAEALAEAFEALGEEIPRRKLGADEAASIHQYRAGVEMRVLMDERYRVYASDPGTAWTVVVDPEPRLTPSPLNRTAVLRPLAQAEEVVPLLAPWRGALISAVVEAPTPRREAISELLAAAGVTRITRAGKAQQPASAVHHDGINALAHLARYILREP